LAPKIKVTPQLINLHV